MVRTLTLRVKPRGLERGVSRPPSAPLSHERHTCLNHGISMNIH
jgi:hypothetical protein